MSREKYLPKSHSLKISNKRVGIEIYLYEVHGRFAAVGWLSSRAVKPHINTLFASAEQREQRLTGYVTRAIEAHNQRAALNAPHNFKVGDVFYCTWGYEQTNVDFYEVVGVPSPHYVTVREVRRVVTERTGYEMGTCVPDQGMFCGEPQRLRVTNDSIRINDHRRAYRWHGRPVTWTSHY